MRLPQMPAPARSVLGTVTPLGWTVLTSSVGAGLIGRRLGWAELTLASATGLLLLSLCGLLTIGRTRLRVDLTVTPSRVVAGSAATGQVKVTNLASRRLLPLTVELPIGRDAAQLTLPSLPGRGSQQELFGLPAERRGVVPIGPASTVRGDPFGLLRRTVSWTGVTELIIHPTTVPLPPYGSGLVRDLDGQTTNEVSMSDLAFHTLRDYAPGDDRRYIHWRSSAKFGATTPGGKLLVRQFLDTRRSHITVLIDGDPAAYPDPDDYETAISAGASIVSRAVRDEQTASVVAGGHLVPAGTGRALLDALARADFGAGPLTYLAPRAAAAIPETSLLIAITGSAIPFSAVRQALAHFPVEVRRIAIQIAPGQQNGIRTVDALTVLTIGRLAGLATVLAAAVAP
jgi:uncharacterized protein (DUF58 family)